MERTQISVDMKSFPDLFHPFLTNATVYDSSCSKQARVWFIDKEGGFYLKSAPKGSLQRESALTRYFHSKHMAAEVLAYESLEQDWLLTTRVPGEDCLYPPYMEDPKRLCDTLAYLLRELHGMDFSGCPVPDRMAEYCATAEHNYRTGQFDRTLFPDNWGYATPEEAWAVIEANRHLLRSDCLLHGDYCFPNIMLDNWKFSGFIDLDSGGVGDRHLDLFWGTWSLNFNLKTDAYRERFLDAYGRDAVNPDMFPVIAAFEVFG
jgi:kanamycin kinase